MTPQKDTLSRKSHLSTLSNPRRFNNSVVEQNLLGSPSKDVGIIDISELRQIRRKAEEGKQRDASMITKAELNRMKEGILDRNELRKRSLQKRMSEKESRMDLANQRKERMAEFDKVREANEENKN